MIKSWPDHVCASVHNNSTKNVVLLGLDNNFGDHRAIGFNVIITENEKDEKTIKKPIEKVKFFWSNGYKTNIYSNQFELKLAENLKTYERLCVSNDQTAQHNINEMYKLLSKTLVEESTNHVTDNQNKKKRKKWWCPLISKTHIEVCLAYREYKNSNFNSIQKRKFYEVKRLFRLQKRALIRLKSERNLCIISKYFKLNRNEFWAKVNRLGRNKVNINIQLCKLKDHYRNLFNSPNNIDNTVSNENIDKFKENTEKHKKPRFDYNLSHHKLKELIDDLPNGKSAGISNISYEHINYCSSNVFVLYLTKLYVSMIQFSLVPENFNIAIIKPIVKDPKAPTDTIDNLRPIAISEVFANLFEKILLHETNKQHHEAVEQFGFKNESSWSHAIAVVKTIIKLCQLRCKPCFIAVLDASKAFDNVERYRLWNKLFEMNLNPAIIFATISYYESLELQVQKGNEISERFGTTNGVRQGGIFSPKLYNIYSGDMIKKVKDSKTGVKCGDLVLGIVMYADDLTLLSDNVKDLQDQIDIIGKQGITDDVYFNAKKSAILIFNADKNENTIFNMNGINIPTNNENRYLKI